MRSLLEIIASGLVSSFHDIRLFIESTLKHTLCTKVWCECCKATYEVNQILFKKESEARNER